LLAGKEELPSTLSIDLKAHASYRQRRGALANPSLYIRERLDAYLLTQCKEIPLFEEMRRDVLKSHTIREEYPLEAKKTKYIYIMMAGAISSQH